MAGLQEGTNGFFSLLVFVKAFFLQNDFEYKNAN